MSAQNFGRLRIVEDLTRTIERRRCSHCGGVFENCSSEVSEWQEIQIAEIEGRWLCRDCYLVRKIEHFEDWSV
jgi:hypothetical protein